MSSGAGSSHALPNSTTVVRIAKLKKISLSDDDDDDVSSVGSDDRRLTGIAAPAPDSSRQPASASSSSSSLTLSTSGHEEEKGGVADGAAREGNDVKGILPGTINARRPSSSSSSSSSSASLPHRPQPPRRQTSRTSPMVAPATVADTKLTTTPLTTSSTTPAAPPSLSGHRSDPTPASQLPSSQPRHARVPQPTAFTPPTQPTRAERDASALPAKPMRIRTFVADTPASSASPPPPAPPPASSSATGSVGVGGAAARPAEPQKPSASEETHRRPQRQRYNRICTDPSAQVVALPHTDLTLTLSRSARAPGRAAHAVTAVQAAERPRGVADPADVTAPGARSATRIAASSSEGPPPSSAASPTGAAAVIAAVVAGEAESGLNARRRMAVQTSRLRDMPQRHRLRRTHSRAAPSATVNEPPHATTSANASSARAAAKETGTEEGEAEESDAAHDGTFAPCAAHQRRTAARAAFDKQLEAELFLRDDMAVPTAAGFGRGVAGAVGGGGPLLADWLLSGRGGGARVGEAESDHAFLASNRLPAPQPIVRSRFAL